MLFNCCYLFLIDITPRWLSLYPVQVLCTVRPGYSQLLLVITLKSVLDTSDRQGRSASLSSDDVVGLSQAQQSLSRSSTLPYDHTPQRAQPQRGGGVRTKTRPSSPGSEMVTLEEFLQESNLQSPPVVRDHVDMCTNDMQIHTIIIHSVMYCIPPWSILPHDAVNIKLHIKLSYLFI